MNKIFYRIFFLFLSAVFFYSCAKEDDITNSTSSHTPFTGTYRFTFTTGASGGGTLTVNNDGSFNSPMSINFSGSSVNVDVKGNVLNSGILSGQVYRDTTSIGVLSGQILSNQGSGNYIGESVALWTLTYIY